MSIRGKTKHRLSVLVVVIALLVVAGAAVYAIRSRQIAADLLRAREGGMAALKMGDYHTALHQIGRYVQRHPTDVAALCAYAQARQHVPLQGGAHLLDAAGFYRRALDLQPDHAEAGHRLLELYLELGYSSETLSLAQQLLGRSPADPDALRAKAIALTRSRKFADALATARRYNEIVPLNVDFQLITLQIMRQAGESDAQLLAYAQTLRTAHPEDPRPELVDACARMMTGDKAGALDTMRKVAARELNDPEVIGRTVGLLDAMGQFSQATVVLERVAGLNPEPRTTGMVVERWWQLRQWQKIADLPAASGAAGQTIDSRLAALRATALIRLGRRQEAEPILAMLKLRQDDAEAAAWSQLIPVAFGAAAPDPKELLTACNDATIRVPGSPYFRFLLAQAAEQMGDRELALEYWRKASELAPSWAGPYVERSRVLLQLGRVDAALAAAREARNRCPRDPEVLMASVLAGAQTVNEKSTEQVASLGELLDQIHGTTPEYQPAISARILLLARSGQREAALQAIAQALAMMPPLGEETLLAIAAASESSGLGQEDACYEQCLNAHGWTADLALAEARTLQKRGRPQEALALFSSATSRPRIGQEMDWRLAEARYRDEIGDPGAKPLWIDLVEQNPARMTVQWEAEAARCLAGERSLRDRILERLEQQTGAQGVAWRMARARWLLESQPTERQVVEAAGLLSEATRIAPEELSPHYLLAQCMERLNNPTVAIEQFTIVAEGDKSHHDAALRLARLLNARGEAVRARSYVDRVLQSGPLPASTLRQVAAVLAELGDADRAVQVVEALRQAHASARGSDLLLARIYWERKETAKAEALLDTLLQDADQEVVRFAIEFYLGQKRPADAEKALALLDSTGADPAVAAAIRGHFYTRTGRPDQALQVYQAGAEAAPASPVIWRALVLHHLSGNNIAAALAAAEEAGKKAPRDEALAALRKQHDAIQELAGEPMLPALLVTALGSADATAPAYEALGVMARARKAGETPAQLAKQLRPLADRNPRLLPLQLILVRNYLAGGKLDDAVLIANRTAQLFPGAAEPARASATALAAAGRWAEALDAAQRWRKLAPEQGADADAVIASAHLGLGQVDKALQWVLPYTEAAWTAPDTEARWIILWSQAQLRLRHPVPVERSLLPLIRVSPQWRKVWMRLAVEQIATGDAAGQWLLTVAGYIPRDALEERIALAGAWQQLAQRTHKPQDDAHAKQLVAALVPAVQGSRDLSGEQVETLATLCEAQEDRGAAVALYRQALQRDRRLALSMNNLAAILAEAGGDLAEAESLAAAVVKDHPEVAAYQDTLAAVNLRRGRFAPAAECLSRAVEMQPGNCAYRIRLAGALLGNGEDEKARQMLKHIEAFQPDGMTLPERDREQLKSLRARLAVAAR